MNYSQKPGFFGRIFGKSADEQPDDAQFSDERPVKPIARTEQTAPRPIPQPPSRSASPRSEDETNMPQFSRAAARGSRRTAHGPRLERLRDAFTPSHPIANAQRFAGRRELLEQLIHLIEDQQLHVVLYGDRGIGKTSILRIVANLARDANYHVNYASCGSDTSFDSLFRQFASELKLLNHVDYSPTHPDVEAGKTFATLMPDRDLTVADVTALFEKVQNTRILFIVDEFDRVASPRMREQIAEVIKNLSDRGSPIQFFIAGVASNLTALVSHIPSIRRNLIGMPVKPLDEKEIAQIVEAGARQSGLHFSADAIRAVGQLSRGLPYLAQLLSLHASFSAARRNAEEVEARDVESGAEKAEEEIGLRLSERGKRATEMAGQSTGWRPLRMLAEHAMIENGRLSPSEADVLDPTSRDLLLQPIEDDLDGGWQFQEEALIPYIWLKTRDVERV